MGDACHPVLTECFGLTSDVDTALAVHGRVRKGRAEKIQGSTLDTRKVLHLPDGPEQRERDWNIRNAARGGEKPDKWADGEW
jgi:hypothetical protein